MKTKKLKRFVCLLLAFVVLLAMPLNTQAHAAVAVPWVMYAIITGLAAMGITFTVAGGVDAMIDAVEQKVNEYQTQTGIHLPIIILENTRIEPPSQPPSGWNKKMGYFFLAFNAAMALTVFADWLVNDGGWSEGEIIQNELFSYYYSVNVDGVSKLYESPILGDSIGNGRYNVLNQFDTINYSDTSNVKIERYNTEGSLNLYHCELTTDGHVISYSNGTKSFEWDISDELNSFSWNVQECGLAYILSGENNGLYSVIHTYVVSPDKSILFYVGNQSSGKYGALGYSIESSLEVSMPQELPQFSVSENEGLLIESGATAAETLEELGELFETVFTDTGTIPQPQPQVITDPATQPVPTPAPTAPPIQDVDDLGLPTLGEAVFNKFPFSLPRDLKRIAEILNADPVTPYWEVDLFAPLADDISFAGDTTLRIDLSEYEALGQISRWASVIGFCIMLIIITKGVIKW